MKKYNRKLLTNNAFKANNIDMLINAANLADTPKELLFSEEPTIMEHLGLTIRMVRKKKRLDCQNLALLSKCSPEIITALEMGLLPIKEIGLYLPNILRGLGMEQDFIEKVFQSFTDRK